MNPNSQSANVPELPSQAAKDQALSPGSAAIFNANVNLQAQIGGGARCRPDLHRDGTQESLEPYSCELAFGNPPLIRNDVALGERRRTWSRGVL